MEVVLQRDKSRRLGQAAAGALPHTHASPSRVMLSAKLTIILSTTGVFIFNSFTNKTKSNKCHIRFLETLKALLGSDFQIIVG